MRDIIFCSRQQIEAALRPILVYPGISSPKYAVLLPLICMPDEPEILLEVRAAGISQSGDPCFPGGHIEADETPEGAAVRELEEELGIPASAPTVLGRLPTVHTPLGIKTDVLVGTLSEQDAENLHPNRSEVAKILRVPLNYFLQRPHDSAFPWDGESIWGMTAGGIRHFCAAWREAGLE